MKLYCPNCQETGEVDSAGKLLDHSPDCTCGHVDCPAVCLMRKCPKCMTLRTLLITMEQYVAMSPNARGFTSYMQASLPGSELSDDSPYAAGTTEHEEWMRGRVAASNAVADMSE